MAASSTSFGKFLKKFIISITLYTGRLPLKTADFEIACRIRRYIDAIKNDPTNPDNNPDWIDWASKKADWIDPTVAREDEFFGKRKHGVDADQKELKRRW